MSTGNPGGGRVLTTRGANPDKASSRFVLARMQAASHASTRRVRQMGTWHFPEATEDGA